MKIIEYINTMTERQKKSIIRNMESKLIELGFINIPKIERLSMLEAVIAVKKNDISIYITDACGIVIFVTKNEDLKIETLRVLYQGFCITVAMFVICMISVGVVNMGTNDAFDIEKPTIN